MKITIDYREKQCLVPSLLVKHGFEIELKELKVADYLVNGLAIERKTIDDFISSMINKRLLNQLEELQQYPNKLLIIEGLRYQELYDDKNIHKPHSNSIKGFLLSILLRHKVPIIFTKDQEDTASFISILAKKKKQEMPIRANKKTLNKKEQQQLILEGFPGIGAKTAKKLLKEFKSIQNIINAKESELTKVIGKKAESFKIIKENY